MKILYVTPIVCTYIICMKVDELNIDNNMTHDESANLILSMTEHLVAFYHVHQVFNNFNP